jgi:hypothetical protein
MRLVKPMALALKWILALAVVGAFAAGYFIIEREREKQRKQEATEGPADLPKIKEGLIKISKQQTEGFRVQAAKDIEWVPKVAVYGRVVANPRATTEVRAAFAGKLRSGKDAKWPVLADTVAAGATLGYLEVRIGPQDRLDFQAKLGEAKLKQEGASKALDLYEKRVQRFKSADAGLARSEYETALIGKIDADTQLAVATAAVKLYQEALATLDQHTEAKQTTWVVPVTAPAAGEIVELAARPDMIVESGGLIARVVDFRKVLVRVDVPLSLQALPPTTLPLVVLPPTPAALEGPTNRPEPPPPAKSVPAELVGVAAQIDPTLQAVGYLYEITDLDGSVSSVVPVKLWRPGLFVKAQLNVNADKPISATAIPASALLYHQGRALVYVRETSADPKYERYKRNEVKVLGRDGDWWVIEWGVVDADDLVVTVGNLALLSLEFRADVDD